MVDVSLSGGQGSLLTDGWVLWIVQLELVDVVVE